MEEALNKEMEQYKLPPNDPAAALNRSSDCTVNVATDAVISWSCDITAVMKKGYGDMGIHSISYVNYLLTGKAPTRLTIKDLLISGGEKKLQTKLNDEIKKQKISSDEAPVLENFLIEPEGLSFSYERTRVTDDGASITFSYADLAPLLKPEGPISLVQRAVDAPDPKYFDTPTP
jgi:hypothetical protein